MKRAIIIASLGTLMLSSAFAFGQTEPEKPKVARGTAQKIVSAVEIYTKNADLPGSVKALEELKKSEKENYYVNSWLGYLYIKQEKYADAVAPLKAAHAAQPKDIDVLLNLAHAQDKSNDKAGANDSYFELNKSKPGDAVVLTKLGVYSLDKGDTATAISYLEQADKAAPKDKVITTNLAVAYQKAGDRDKANAAYQRLLELDPDNVTKATALSWLGYASIQAGDFNQAIDHLKAARALRENDLEILNNLAYSYLKVNPSQDENAAEVYRQMVAMSPTLYEPWYNLGTLYLKQKNADKAVEANEKALERKPDEPFALNNLGRAYEMQGRFAMAGDKYARASDKDPQNLTFAHNAGAAYSKAKDDVKAKIYLERAISDKDEDTDVALALGNIYLREGKTDAAMKLLEKAGDKVENRSDLWFNLGATKQKEGDDRGAEECYRKALEIKPDDMDANQNLGLILYNRGDWKGATPYFEKVAGSTNNSVDAKLNLAAVYYMGSRVKDAMELWKEVLHMDSKRTDVRLNLANALWSMGEYESAGGHYKTAVTERPNSAQALNGVGLWYLREGRNAEAEKSFRAAVNSDSKYMPSYNNLAVALERLNKRKEAISVLKQALVVKPDYEEARKNLERLKSAEN